MNIDKYNMAIDRVHDMLNDLSNNLTGNKTSLRDYVIIPSAKKGKNHIKFNIKDMNQTMDVVIFLSKKTTGIKFYDENHRLLYDYSVSRNNDKQVIQLNFANGTGVRAISEFNPDTNSYELLELDEIVKAKGIVNLNQFSDPVINDELLISKMFQISKDTSTVGFYTSYGKAVDPYGKKIQYYQINEHPEFSQISQTLHLHYSDVMSDFVNAVKAINSTTFTKDISKFKSSFKTYLQKLQKDSGNQNISNDNPDFGDR